MASPFGTETVLDVRHWTDAYFSFTTTRDDGFRFDNGQFVMIGLEVEQADGARKPLMRAYSIASPNWDEQLEFFSIKVQDGPLTSRLQHIRPGDSILIGRKPTGTLLISDVHPGRNLYLLARPNVADRTFDRVEGWIGSRMYRGDDIYLLDVWPLDDQNTVGAGVELAARRLTVASHVGWSRLTDPFQLQTIAVADPAQGATTVTQLDRLRTVGSISARYHVLGDDLTEANVAVKVHAEVHALPSGERRRDDATVEALPRDWGSTLGLELSAYGFDGEHPGGGGHGEPGTFKRHLNLFARWSRGLAAYDELTAPSALGPDLRTFPRASELVLGAGANWDADRFALAAGVLARRFVDADRDGADRDDGWEYTLAARPMLHLEHRFYAGVDLSFEARFPRGLAPTSQRAADPAVAAIAPILAWSPAGPSSYDRPQLRLVYRAAHQNAAALDQYVPDDPRRAAPWVHYLGVQAEWWFNSSYR